MSELIEKRDVYNILKDMICFVRRDVLLNAYDTLKNLPTVKPASPWHRCEDELPEKEGDYLVWTMLYGGHAYTDYYTPKYGWDEYKVIAWMPLPEPPKEENE